MNAATGGPGAAGVVPGPGPAGGPGRDPRPARSRFPGAQQAPGVFSQYPAEVSVREVVTNTFHRPSGSSEPAA